VWYAEQFGDWDPACTKEDAPMSVVQSALDIPVDRIVDRLGASGILDAE
jgi:hypothetical protein